MTAIRPSPNTTYLDRSPHFIFSSGAATPRLCSQIDGMTTRSEDKHDQCTTTYYLLWDRKYDTISVSGMQAIEKPGAGAPQGRFSKVLNKLFHLLEHTSVSIKCLFHLRILQRRIDCSCVGTVVRTYCVHTCISADTRLLRTSLSCE